MLNYSTPRIVIESRLETQQENNKHLQLISAIFYLKRDN